MTAHFFVVFPNSYGKGLLFTNKKNTSIKESANTALATLRQDSRTMSILRSSLQSRMNFIITNKGNTENYQEMTWVLELVKKGELILNAICDSVESAQYLEEFIIIISNAALSMGEVTRYIENTIAISEASLSELHDSISKLPSAALPDSKQAIEPAILSELSTLLAVDKTHTTKDATVTWALEKGEGRDEDVHGQAESVMA